MQIPKQKFREAVFLILYSHDMAEPAPNEIIKLVSKELKISKKAAELAFEKFLTIRPNIAKIDENISIAATEYAFERIQRIERNILRLGIFEMELDDEIPPKVAIAEGIRLARKFSTKESANFINAVLDHRFRELQGLEADREKIKETLEKMIEREKSIENEFDSDSSLNHQEE